jgi:CheY-like chemotaxis protein
MMSPDIMLALSGFFCEPKLMKPLRVLVIEDDALIAMLLEQILADLGHNVCAIAGTETEAVLAAHCHRPDLMIVDAGLGRGSGISAMDQILSGGPVAHVFVSGDPDKVRNQKPQAIIVRKPFRQVELADAIIDALAAAPPAA